MPQQGCFGRLYDISAQVISILDVTTDIIVCIEFYQDDRMIFFNISLTILCLALIAYDIAFIQQFSCESNCFKQIGLFLALLPCSPLIPLVFYYVGYGDSKFGDFIEEHYCFNIYFEKPTEKRGASKFKQFYENKVSKHMGFILESLVEAFPQAILQMTSIVIFNEPNIISIISILISLLSVASKSFVFSMGSATNIQQLLFNWLCAVTDFFGIFFVVCWVFYEPQDDTLKEAFVMIQQIWLYKLYIFQFAMIGVLAVLIEILVVLVIAYETDGSFLRVILVTMVGVFVSVLLCACCIIASVLGLEILTWTWIATTFLVIGTKRFPGDHKLSLQFWWTLMKWINAAQKHHIGSKYKGCTSYTRQQDKMMRLASVNYIVCNYANYEFTDGILHCYLMKNQKENQYMNVTFKGLRSNTSAPIQSQFIKRFWDLYSGIMRDGYRDLKSSHQKFVLNKTCHYFHEQTLDFFYVVITSSFTLLFGPVYFVGRLLTILFPVFIVLYLYFEYNVILWNTNKIGSFQVVMITIYIGLSAIVLILLCFNIKQQYLMWHILPSLSAIAPLTADDETTIELKIKAITNHYYGMTIVPIRRAIVIETFGTDLGKIIVSYLPTDDDFDASDNIVKVKTVV